MQRVTRIVALTLAGLAFAACPGPTGQPAAPTPSLGSVAPPAATASPGPEGARFPAGSSDDGRYFVDQEGDAWFGRGDTAWSLIGQLDPTELERYLDDRAARGFNLVLTNVLEHHFSDNAPNNYRNDPPFTGEPFSSSPNEAYWQHVDYVVEAARLRGITMLLCPAYLGWSDDEGWAEEIRAASEEQLAEFGRFLRNRYGQFTNIMWLIGHDRVPDATEKARMEALAAELPADDLVGLGATPSADALGSVPWESTTVLPDFETIYTYDDTSAQDTALAWAMTPARPIMFLEGRYEQERDGGLGDPMLRRQDYGSFIAGASAAIFGNNPIWHFESVSLYDYEGTWQDNLSSPGTGDAQRFADFVNGLPWWQMHPDIAGELLVNTDLPGNTGARFSSSHAVVYVPTSRSVVLDLSKLTAVQLAELTRFDPRTGESEEVAVYGTDEIVTVDSPGPNAAGDDDWLYVLSPAD